MDTELRRVRNDLQPAILQFFNDRKPGDTFHACDLPCPSHCSPESPLRVMRLLKSKGKVSYRCIKRSESLYEVA